MQQAIAQWLAGPDTGSSSKTIAFWLGFGIKYHYASVPADPADLGRCLRLLDAVPDLRDQFAKMAELGGLWPTYVERWAEIERSMIDEVGIDWSKGKSALLTYNLMHLVEADAYRAAGYDVETDDSGHVRWARKAA